MIMVKNGEASRELYQLRATISEDPFDFDRFYYLLGKVRAYEECLHLLSPDIWRDQASKVPFDGWTKRMDDFNNSLD